MVLLLAEEEVESLLSMILALEAVEEAFRSLGLKEAQNQPRRRIMMPRGTLHVMAAGLAGMRSLGFKAYTSFPAGTRYYVFLFDGENGEPLCIAQGRRLGQVRTGAASGVATKYMARADASTVGIVGSGWQARSQLEAVCAVRRITEVKAYGRSRQHLEAFCREMDSRLNVRVVPCSSAKEAVKGVDIVITATNSSTPVVEGEWLAEGVHLNAIGSNWPQRREMDDYAVGKSGTIVVDSKEQAMLEAGDLLMPASRGLLSWDRVLELGDVVLGRAAGRRSRAEVTLFKSVGLALEDVAVAARLYEAAKAGGFGRSIDF